MAVTDATPQRERPLSAPWASRYPEWCRSDFHLGHSEANCPVLAADATGAPIPAEPETTSVQQEMF
jgi:hypothetical protein